MSPKEKPNKPVLKDTAQRRQRYQRLVDEFYTDIYRYAFWLSKSQQVAEDLVQETFLRAWRALDSLQKDSAAKAWLFTILRRENARLYEKYQPDLDDIDNYPVPDKPLDEPEVQMERNMLFKAMAELEPEYKEPLMLQVIGGFSGEEIANMLDLNNNTVMTRLFRARNKLKETLDPDPKGK